MSTPPSHDLTRITLTVLFIVLLLAVSLWVMLPFLPAIIWATMIVVATWPMLLRLEQRTGGRRYLAVAVMTTALLLLFVIPFLIALLTIIVNLDLLADWVKSLPQLAMPLPPEWLTRLPLIGTPLHDTWLEIARADTEELRSRLFPYLTTSARWLAGKAGGLGMVAVHFMLTVIVSAIFYARGEAALDILNRFARRMAGEQGMAIVILAGEAIRSVAIGVVVTAAVQSLFTAIGLLVAGLPLVPLLTALAFFFSIIQVGPLPVLAPAVFWLYWQGHPGWGTALLIWTVIITSLDNILRPILIRRGGGLPLLLVLVGILGGLVAFGMVGIFIGPLTLAVTYTLFNNWANPPPHPGPAPAQD